MELLIDKNPSEVEIHTGRRQRESFVTGFAGELSHQNPVVRFKGFRCCLVDADDMLKIEPIYTFKPS